jgi:glutamate-5-semialdehyde dehydrogenase
MTAPLQAIDGNADLPALMTDLAVQARVAARVLALAPPEQKNRALEAIERAIRANAAKILAANADDVAEVKAGGATSAFLDRLTLTQARVDSMADGVATVRGIADPVGTVTESWQRPNGMTIERVRVPLGVIGVIFESRPNVAADAGVLCLKSGNAVILRGGSDSFRSCRAIHDCLAQGLREAGLPEAAITLVPTRDRAAVGLMLSGLNGGIDVIVPRGGKSLVARVEAEARVPVFAHLEGVNHVYVDRTAKLDMAKSIVLNAKMRRTGVCGAAETLLVDRAAAATNLKPLVEMLLDSGCEVRGDDAVQQVDARVKPATDEDWDTEYLDAVIAARVVDGVDAAIAHIQTHGSRHTDAIVAEDAGAAEKFLSEVDSAIVLHNASTQFADGGEFGFGAEIGIATGKFHARGPVGAEQLTSFKYRVHGTGQTRPLTLAGACGDLADDVAIGRTSHPVPHQRHARRPARRFVQSAARGASRHQPVCAQAPQARSRLVAADAGQSAQGKWPAAGPRRARKGGPGGRLRSAHRHQLSRSRHRHQIHCRYDHPSAPARFRRAFRLDHGRRQSRAIPPVAELAAHCRRGADCGDRSPAREFSSAFCAGRTGPGALSAACKPGGPSGGSARSRLGFPHRPETEYVVDRPAEPGRKLEDKEVTVRFEPARGATGILKPLTPHA